MLIYTRRIVTSSTSSGPTLTASLPVRLKWKWKSTARTSQSMPCWQTLSAILKRPRRAMASTPLLTEETEQGGQRAKVTHLQHGPGSYRETHCPNSRSFCRVSPMRRRKFLRWLTLRTCAGAPFKRSPCNALRKRCKFGPVLPCHPTQAWNQSAKESSAGDKNEAGCKNNNGLVTTTWTKWLM